MLGDSRRESRGFVVTQDHSGKDRPKNQLNKFSGQGHEFVQLIFWPVLSQRQITFGLR